MEFSNENVINAVHNEPSLWDPNVNANEEEKEMAWKRISDAFGIKAGGYYLSHFNYAFIVLVFLEGVVVKNQIH